MYADLGIVRWQNGTAEGQSGRSADGSRKENNTSRRVDSCGTSRVAAGAPVKRQVPSAPTLGEPGGECRERGRGDVLGS